MNNVTHAPPRRGFLAWWARGFCSLGIEMVRRWYLFAALCLIWTLAAFRVFGSHTPMLPVLFNVTPSIPYRVVWADYGARRFTRGDLIVYSFDGPAAQTDFPGLLQQPFFKRVVGVAGDTVTVVGREVFVNGMLVGAAKTHSFDRRPLAPIDPGVIPEGHLYVQGTSADSFDSRYRSSGLVRITSVRAKVHPIF